MFYLILDVLNAQCVCYYLFYVEIRISSEVSNHAGRKLLMLN